MTAETYSLGKEERLRSRKKLEQVFQSGQTLSDGPIRVLWICENAEVPFPVQAAFVSPKKLHKLAVRRNLIKRRMKEAFRKNKCNLISSLQEKKLSCSLVFVYFYKEILNYRDIEKHLVQSIQLLIQRIEKGN